MMAKGKYIWLEAGHSSADDKHLGNNTHRKMKALAAVVENASLLIASAKTNPYEDDQGFGIAVDPDLLNSLDKSIQEFKED